MKKMNYKKIETHILGLNFLKMDECVFKIEFDMDIEVDNDEETVYCYPNLVWIIFKNVFSKTEALLFNNIEAWLQ